MSILCGTLELLSQPHAGQIWGIRDHDVVLCLPCGRTSFDHVDRWRPRGSSAEQVRVIGFYGAFIDCRGAAASLVEPFYSRSDLDAWEELTRGRCKSGAFLAPAKTRSIELQNLKLAPHCLVLSLVQACLGT